MQRLTSNPIQELRRILNDQYSFGSIIKELIQNADDAGATEFHLAWFPDWQPATHPLLTGPTILCLNDGAFRVADTKAICRLDEGAKGSDLGTIGKYGLGMKSVFHLCESFFYVASPNQPAACGRPFVELLNPWPEGGPHDHWGEMERARDEIVRRIADWKHDTERWFCLVIPLRTPDHLQGAEAILQGQFPRIDQLLGSYEPHDLATLTILLRTLRRITVWQWNQTRQDLEIDFRLELDEQHLRRRRFPALGPDEKHSMRVEVLRHSSARRVLLRTCGVERLLASNAFVDLKQDQRWPKNFTLNPETGRSEDALEKAEPHAAVVFTVRDAATGALCIRDAVFLPLSRGERETIRLEGDKHFEVILYGLYFLDAGRRELYSADGPDGSLQELWNKRLLEKGVLPLVLPALHEFVAATSLSDGDIGRLTSALHSSELFRSFRQSICSRKSWIDPLSVTEPGPRWRLEDSSTGVLECPSLHDRANLAARVFAALPQVCQARLLVQRDRPRLTLREPYGWADDESVLVQLIESLEPRELHSCDALALATDFLRVIGPAGVSVVAPILARKLRQCVMTHGVRALENVRDPFVELIGTMPEATWVRLGPLEKDTAPIYREVNRLDLAHVILPADLCPAQRPGDRLSIDESKRICEWLQQSENGRPPERTAAVALCILSNTVGTREEKLRCLGDYKLLLVRDGRERSPERLVSWATLSEYFTHGWLFAGGSADLGKLQAAVGCELLSMYEPKGSDAFGTLFHSEKRQCTPAECVQLLLTGPALRNAESREELFKRLIAATEGVDRRMRQTALRFLLHGNAEKIGDLDSGLLIRTSLKKNNASSRVADEALRRTGDGWRAVPDVLCRHANDEIRELLGVQDVDGQSLTEILQRAAASPCSLQWIGTLGLTAREAEDLLLAIVDPALRRSVPLHRVATGRDDASPYVALYDQPCFIVPEDDGIRFEGVAQIVTLLARPSDSRLLQAYQAEGVTPWGPLTCLRVALASAAPHQHVEDILSALESLDGPTSADVLKLLREVRWLPTRFGPAAPRDVVDLERLDTELARLLDEPAIGNAFTSLGAVGVDWRRHDAALNLMRSRRVLPALEDSVELLAMCLGELPAFRLGEIDELRAAPHKLNDVIRAFRDCPVRPRVLGLVGLLFRHYEDRRDEIATRLVNGVLRPVDVTTLREWISGLTASAHQRNAGAGSVEHRVLALFLRTLVVSTEFTPAALSGLNLLARDGTWRAAEQLCIDAESVADEYLLDADLRDVFPESFRRKREFGSRGAAVSDPSEPESAGASSMVIVDYFDRWRGWVPRPAVGGFLALLGDEEATLSEATESLMPRSVRDVREQINWEPIAGSETVGADEDIHTIMRKQRFRVRFGRDGEPIRLRNLLGECFEARIGGQSNTLFVGNLFFEPAVGRCKSMTLRELDPSRFSSQRLAALLLESCRALLRDVYCRSSTHIDKLWEQLAEATQLQVEIVQQVILDSAWIVLEQLGLRGMSSIRDLARRRDELERQRVEAQYSREPAKAREDVEARLAALNAELRQVIECDEHVQREMLGAVREKMARHYQYSLGSLPYELFQNADDAVAELMHMLGQPPSRGPERLVQFTLHRRADGRDALTALHWGRPINEFHRGSFAAEDGRRAGYDTDLRKMLLLAASDKRERSSIVTGKFGLGFKTVYFAADRPQVMSGDLVFEVVGGLLPRRLETEACEYLASMLRSAGAGRRDGTIIRLPLTCNRPEMVKALLSFVRHLPLMLAFSRCVKACEVSLDDETVRVEWTERALAGETAVAGRADVLGLVGSVAVDRAVVFRDGAEALLLKIDPTGAVAFDPSVPVFWVSAPTRTDSRAGLAVNGAFRVDVGRTQLACQRDGNPLDESVEVAHRLGRCVGEGLISLFDAIDTRWPTCREELGLLHELTSAEFWISVWDVLIGAARDGNPLLQELIWGHDCGLECALAQRPLLPTGLSGAFAGLTSVNALRGLVVGVLDADADLFTRVAEWPSVSRTYDSGSLISQNRVLKNIPSGVVEESGLAHITLETVLRMETAEAGVASDVASRLGSVVTREAIRSWESVSTPGRPAELDRLRTALRGLRFRTRNGDWRVAGELLVSQSLTGDVERDRKDELRRAAFAPPDRVLHEEYSGTAAEFVLACRGPLNAPAELLAEWVLHSEAESRAAALRYLLDGDLGRHVAQIVRGRRASSWVSELGFTELATLGFTEEEQGRLLPETGVPRSGLAQMYSEAPSAPGSLRAYGPEVLRSIAAWWADNSVEELTAYDAAIYPDGQFPIRQTRSESLDRGAWLRLILLACTRSMGPFTDEQHRNFLRLCDQHGWIDRLSHIRSDPFAWLACWSEYVDGQVDRITYYHWMKNLLGLSLVARHLDEYVDAFLAVDRFSRPFALEEITSPRASSAFAGGGPDAPPIGPILGVGQSFVMRELVRHGMLSNRFAYPWCFLPLRRVRSLIERLGGPVFGGNEPLTNYSKRIHAFLSENLNDPTFGLAFDIPLTIVARRGDLWERLVGAEPPELGLDTEEGTWQ